MAILYQMELNDEVGSRWKIIIIIIIMHLGSQHAKTGRAL